MSILRLLVVVLSVAARSMAVAEAAPDAELPVLHHFDSAWVDRSADPCSDFYKYVCSKWFAANPIPTDESVWGTWSNLQLWNETVLRRVLEDAAKLRSDRDAREQKIGDYWASCIDERTIDAAGLKPIAPQLDRIAAMRTKKDIARVLADLHLNMPNVWQGNDNQTFAPMLGFGPQQDYADATLMIAVVDQGGMGMPGREYYLADNPRLKETRAKYREHVRRMFVLLGESPAHASADAARVLVMETQLARSAMDAVARRDPKNTYNVRTLQQLKALAPSFDWDAYLKAVDAPAPAHYVVTSPAFLEGLEDLIRRESLASWKAYLRWWTILANANYLSPKVLSENFAFYGHVLTGAQELRPRWRRCVAYADRDLGQALGAAYVAKAFPAQSKERIDVQMNATLQALGRDIDSIAWMSAETKRKAQEKLAAIEKKIGYPDRWRDYSGVRITRDGFIENVHQATAFELRRQLKKIGQPVDRAEWGMTPPTVNAYYDAQLNSINFPAGILRAPLFDSAADDAVNYGAIGMVIGHEIIHGFDDQGRKFDARGDLRDWWTPDDAKRYDERGKCIADQYTGDLPELGVKQDGRLTQGEDTADNGGLRIAFMALEQTYRSAGRSLDVEESDGWTARQRFFLSHAFSWCDGFRPEYARTLVVTNPHSLSELRVNNVEANMPEFWRAFGCKKGQRMVRENACRVW